MNLLLIACLLGLANLSRAVTLELEFDQPTFSINTSGSFRLYGEIPINSIGWSSDGTGITSYTMPSSYRGANTANLPNNYYFTLDSYDASGTVLRDGITSSVLPNTRAVWLQIFNQEPNLQIYVGPSPTPSQTPFLPATVNLTGRFTVNSSVNSGQSPDSQGITFNHLAGTYQTGPYDQPGEALTITIVPEPSTLSLFSLAAIPLFFHRRKSC